ncbi:hypothetical protein SAMN05216574_115136 [Blastococcus tunisiensis]|uniref:Uncharacterized protein n=1 Tax=Blastococcus tunisiensis TaxID=1798228 RepID=A0A1I2JG89_9ACTN|nr:hypothetical protein SAMN05216574_115136 [Blastococcus sp. DSM 46838]
MTPQGDDGVRFVRSEPPGDERSLVAGSSSCAERLAS